MVTNARSRHSVLLVVGLAASATAACVAGEQGDKGDKGDMGDMGIQGIQGIQGIPGTPALLVDSPVSLVYGTATPFQYPETDDVTTPLGDPVPLVVTARSLWSIDLKLDHIVEWTFAVASHDNFFTVDIQPATGVTIIRNTDYHFYTQLTPNPGTIEAHGLVALDPGTYALQLSASLANGSVVRAYGPTHVTAVQIGLLP